jgi:hypothetical protein
MRKFLKENMAPLLAILVLAVAASIGAFLCVQDEFRTVQVEDVNCHESNERRASFILQCIENANPKSDEEPEDWLYICERMSIDLYCKTTIDYQHQIKRYQGHWEILE